MHNSLPGIRPSIVVKFLEIPNSEVGGVAFTD